MTQIWYPLVERLLPFEWARHEFMKNALLAVFLVSPGFAVMGTMVVNNKMAFFSDAVGHSALTGIAIGVLLGFRDPLGAMTAFAVLLAVAVSLLKGVTGSSADTVLGVLSSTSVALGIVLLSLKGGFQRYSRFLIGDLLSIAPGDIVALAVVLGGVALLWGLMFNRLLLVSINPSLARSRGVNVKLVETVFCVAVAAMVAVSIQLVGIMLINSLLVLPAAAARNVSVNMRQYHLASVAVSLVAGIVGLVISYYLGTATGATIVLAASCIYVLTLVLRGVRRGGVST